jgi:hypothetical protein
LGSVGILGGIPETPVDTTGAGIPDTSPEGMLDTSAAGIPDTSGAGITGLSESNSPFPPRLNLREKRLFIIYKNILMFLKNTINRF